MSSATKPRICHSKVTISASNNVIIYNDGTADRTATYPTIALGDAFVRGDGVATIGQTDMLSIWQTAFNTAPSTNITDFVFSLNNTEGANQGKVTISAGSNFDIEWTNGSTSFDGKELGFDITADDTGAATYTSDNQAKGLWYPRIEAEHPEARPIKLVGQTISASGVTNRQRIAKTSARNVTLRPVFLDRIYTESALTNVAFEELWDDISDGGSILYYPDASSNSDVGHWTVRDTSWHADMDNAAQRMEGTSGQMFQVVLPLHEYVAPT